MKREHPLLVDTDQIIHLLSTPSRLESWSIYKENMPYPINPKMLTKTLHYPQFPNQNKFHQTSTNHNEQKRKTTIRKPLNPLTG